MEKRPLFTTDNDNQTLFKNPDADDYFDDFVPSILVPDYFANVRTDTEEVLGVVGKDYKIVQNIDAFSFFDDIVRAKSGFYTKPLGHWARGNGFS